MRSPVHPQRFTTHSGLKDHAPNEKKPRTFRRGLVGEGFGESGYHGPQLFCEGFTAIEGGERLACGDAKDGTGSV